MRNDELKTEPNSVSSFFSFIIQHSSFRLRCLDEKPTARFALRMAYAAEAARLHAGRHPHAGFGHWRERSHLQHCQRGLATPAALRPPRTPHVLLLATRRRRDRRRDGTRFRLLEEPQPVIRRGG